MSLLPPHSTPPNLPRSVHIFLPNQQMLPLSTEFAPATSPFSDSIHIYIYTRIYVYIFLFLAGSWHLVAPPKWSSAEQMPLI